MPTGVYVRTAETRAKMSAAHRGKPKSDEMRAKLRALTRSPATRAKIAAARRTHGMSHTPTYRSWNAMRHRCLDENYKDYANYGGRGVAICERWLYFENFHADMGERPAGTSIDRIDNDGNYEPGNCRWATRTEQSRNRRPQRPRRKR